MLRLLRLLSKPCAGSRDLGFGAAPPAVQSVYVVQSEFWRLRARASCIAAGWRKQLLWCLRQQTCAPCAGGQTLQTPDTGVSAAVRLCPQSATSAATQPRA